MCNSLAYSVTNPGRQRLTMFLTASLLSGVVGCSQQSEIREYTAPRASERVLTSEVVRNLFPTIPLRWELPGSWREAEADQFSRMAWTAGPTAREARITITDLPVTAGVQPQVVRWRRQLNLPPADDATAGEDTESMQIANGPATWVDLTGPADSILACIITHEDKLWVVRLRGPNATASEEKQTFRSFCESLTLPKARRS
jgi:hypothetical protein